MSRRRIWLGVAVAVALAAGTQGWRAATVREEAKRILVAEQARQRELRTAMASDEKAASQSESATTRTRAELAALNAKPVAAGVPAPASPPKPEVPKTWAEAARRWALEHDRPEAQVRWFAQMREAKRRQHEPLFRRLNLVARQREQFIENLAMRDERHSDLNAAAESQGFGLSDPGISKLRGELYSDYEKEQKALLGEAGYKELVDFDRTSRLRDTVANLAGLATVSGVALTPAQTEQLVRALAESSPAYRKGGRASLTDPDTDWAAVQATLPVILTEEQRTLFATQEPSAGAGGLLHAKWNAELLRATKAEKAKAGGGR